jgi:hypothetical protein
MKIYMRQGLYVATLLVSVKIFSQQQMAGIITDRNNGNINSVLIINISTQQSTLSDTSGNFMIQASENDELRFVKEGYYRSEKKIVKEDFSAPIVIRLQKTEIEIPEVKIKYQPTGNLEKDNKYLNESRKIASLRSELDEYMKSPLNEVVPVSEIPKMFKGPDYNAGQVNVLEGLKFFVGLLKNAKEPKITKANYFETQDFLARVKRDINLDFLKKYGMDDEQIDKFLLYANKTRFLAKKHRKNFKNDVVEFDIKIAFGEYKKLNNLEGNHNNEE